MNGTASTSHTASSAAGVQSCPQTPFYALNRLTALGVRERLVTDLRRDNVPPGRISVLFIKTPRPDEEKQLERMGLRRLSEDDVPHLGSASLDDITWSIVSGFKGLENDVVILAALTNIETDWHQGVAYVGMSRARTRLCVSSEY